MKEIKNRTGDTAQFEHSMTAMSFEMEGLKTTVGRMSDAFSTITDESQSRERFADLITKLDTDIRARDQKTDERITRIEKNMDAIIEEKIGATVCRQFFELETKMENMEQTSLETATKSEDKDSMKEMSCHGAFPKNAKQLLLDSKKAQVEYLPNSERDKARIHQIRKESLTRIFFAAVLWSRGEFGRETY